MENNTIVIKGDDDTIEIKVMFEGVVTTYFGEVVDVDDYNVKAKLVRINDSTVFDDYE